MEALGYNRTPPYSEYLLLGGVLLILPSIINYILYMSYRLDVYQDIDFGFSNYLDYFSNRLCAILLNIFRTAASIITAWSNTILNSIGFIENVQNPTRVNDINYKLLFKNPVYVLVLGSFIIFYSHYEGFGTPPPIVFSTLIAVSTTLLYENFINQIIPPSKKVADWFSILIVVYISLVPV